MTRFRNGPRLGFAEMPTGLENARALYLEGIQQGDYARAIGRYAGARYTQHSHPVPDGKEGFKAFFAEFVKAHPERDIRIVRSFQDGPLVFVNAVQHLDGGSTNWVTFDLFDTDDDGRLIEHWDIIQALDPNTEAGRAVLGEPFAPTDLHLTETNKDLVRRELEKAQSEGTTRYGKRYRSVKRVAGAGSFVAALSHADVDGVEAAVMDLFCVEGGEVVRRWDAVEPILPREEWVNSGKF